MPRQPFNPQTARLAGLRSGQVRAERKANAEANPQPKPSASEAKPVPNGDPYAGELMRAQRQKLKALLASKDAKEVAALAMALRNLRETYHLATGEARPGIRRETGRRQRPEPAGPAFSLPTEPIPRPVPSPAQAAPSVPGPTTASVGQVQLQPPSTTSAEPIKP